jgi:hypothetical protein
MTPDDVRIKTIPHGRHLARALAIETPALKFRTLKKASADVHSE